MNPLSVPDEIYRVAWGDLVYIKENFIEVLLTGLVGPLLYLIAFGFGIGSSMPGGSSQYVEFILPGIVALTTLSCTFSTVAMRVLVQRLFYMSFDELLLCPVHISSVILGKTLSGVVRSLISCTVLMVAGHLISPGVTIHPLVFVIIIIASWTFSMFGLLASLLTRKTQNLSLFTSIIIVPMTFLCGTLFDVSDLPAAASYIIYALPLTHVSELMRSLMLDGTFPLDSFLVLLLYSALFFSLCYYRIRMQKQ